MELNLAAWERWFAYKVAIKDAYKEVSIEAAKMKLSRFGDDQEAVVDQSIANGYKGLFALKEKKDFNPNDPKKRTPEQQARSEADFARQQSWSNIGWDKLIKTDPLAKLRLCDALLARYQLEEGSIAADKIEWLKERAGAFLREADPAAVLADFSLRRLVLIFWPKNGLQRLRSLVEQKVAA